MKTRCDICGKLYPDESQDWKTDGTRMICNRCQGGSKTNRRVEMVSSEQIKEVHFERVFNLGNYESFRIGLTATVGPKQTAEEGVVMLDEFTIKLRNKRVKEKG
jgi:hypothetical protein